MLFVVRLRSVVCVLGFALVLAACGKKKPTVLPSVLCLKAHAHVLRIVEKEAKAAGLQANLPHATKIQKKEADHLEEQWKRLRSKQGTRQALVGCTNETKEPPKKKASKPSEKVQSAATPKISKKASESPEVRRKRVRCVLASLDVRTIRQCYEPNADLSAYTKPLPFEAEPTPTPTTTTKPLQPTVLPSAPSVLPLSKPPTSLPVSSASSPAQRTAP